MATNRSTGMSDETIKDAASEALRAGVDIRSKVQELTLLALESHKFDRQGIRDVVHVVTEGIAVGADKTRADMRQAIADALAGLDQALRTSAEAGHVALKQLASSSKDFSEGELKQVLANFRRLEEDFLSTVGRVTDQANERVQPALRDALNRARHAGTETGKQVAAVMTEFAQRWSAASLDATIQGLEAAGEFGHRFALVTSGILAGIAAALRPAAPAPDDKKRH